MSRTIEFFYEISKIPRESGNESKIAEYLCDFAEKRNLFYIKDEYNNVIIKKKNSEKEAIILQAHTDMICEKEEGLEFDFTKDGINVYEENGILRAKGTTLGADNGIGIAQILNILDDDNIKCNVEAVFTATEETTMVGAEMLDVSNLTAKKMINLDGFEENTIIKESTCFYDIVLNTNYEFENVKAGNSYEIVFKGLKGGHSGFDIGKNRGNSLKEIVSLLRMIDDCKIVDFVSGSKFNVIPSKGKVIFISTESKQNVEKIVQKYINLRREEYPEISIVVNELELNSNCALNVNETKRLLRDIEDFAHGVFRRNSKDEVITSINLGAYNLSDQIFKIGMRSSRKREEKECLEYIRDYANVHNMKITILGSQPGFETKSSSEFLGIIKDAYLKLGNEDKLKVKSVHITVEAGFFKKKIEDLEIAIISPKIENAHTPEECVEIESVNRCDRWIRNIVESM